MRIRKIGNSTKTINNKETPAWIWIVAFAIIALITVVVDATIICAIVHFIIKYW